MFFLHLYIWLYVKILCVCSVLLFQTFSEVSYIKIPEGVLLTAKRRNIEGEEWGKCFHPDMENTILAHRNVADRGEGTLLGTCVVCPSSELHTEALNNKFE